MSRHASREQGFSTIELLLSLFIAAAFISTGFQLFSVVTKDSDEARMRSTAAGIVNSTIQKQSNNVNEVCGPAPGALTNIPIPTAELPQASYTVTFSCPYGESAKTTRLNVVVTYGKDAEKVEGSLDVTK